jgi:flagellar hook assembly protein FlgD
VSRELSLPKAFALSANRPNPFNPATEIGYEVPAQAHVMLTVYNLLGQEVVRLVDGVKQAGRYSVRWDGRNGQGQTVSSGVYLYRMTSSTGFSETKRMTLLK